MTGLPPPPPGSGAAPSGLPVIPPGGESPLRADAARNRSRLLEAASRLVTEHGAAQLTMDAVATAACVGKGTLFRRFGDRTGLLLALLDHREIQLQTAFLTGPPPVGPGAPAAERLHAFGPAVLRHERDHNDLVLATRTDPLRSLTVPATRLRLSHLELLLREAGAALGDTLLLAHTLLGALDPALAHHLIHERGLPLSRLEAHWHTLLTQLGVPGDTSDSGSPQGS
ncbi:TetR/AcrR family transcriptional regulator [Streptomyces sp. NPDC058045]|uniref:TetR/AcrR family transcriptional regulator n=1 Tax=Streptomyces sp. NPDC058045 TaxID=3346311 RepID=UPI0036E19626